MYTQITYPSADKQTTIHAYVWRPRGQIRATLQIIHGMAEYALRYAPLAEYLAERGFLVCAEDHLGHGQSVLSAGKLGYFARGDAASIVLEDIRRLSQIVAKGAEGLPAFIMGHSMGSFFCRQYISLYGKELAGAVIMGTGYQPAAVTLAGKAVTRAVALFKGEEHRSAFVNALAFGSYNKKFDGRTQFDWLSSDEGSVDRYIADDLCGFMFTCNGFSTLFSILGRACSRRTIKSTPKNLPVLLLSGGDDPVSGYSAGVKKLYDKYVSAGVEDVDMIIYNGFRHEILNDGCAPQVMEDICAFLSSHVK